jgi:hypothetical protein
MQISEAGISQRLDTWPVARLATRTTDGRLHQVPLVFARARGRLWSPVDGKPKRQDATTTEDGAYTLTPDAIANNTVVRNPSATIALPNLDEWYKAAYFDPTTSIYFDYPTGTDEEIGCVVPSSDTGNEANCDSAVAR